jgi:hypothetical protein
VHLLHIKLIPVSKMKNNLSMILFIALTALLAVGMQPNSTDLTYWTDTTMNAYGCFKSGEWWEDLGTDESIFAAYDEQWCKAIAVGMWTLGHKVKNAIRRLCAWLLT